MEASLSRLCKNHQEWLQVGPAVVPGETSPLSPQGQIPLCDSVVFRKSEGPTMYLGVPIFKNLFISLAKRRTSYFIILIILMHWFIAIAIQGHHQLLWRCVVTFITSCYRKQTSTGYDSKKSCLTITNWFNLSFLRSAFWPECLLVQSLVTRLPESETNP